MVRQHNGRPLPICRIFRQLVVENLCILFRNVNRTGLKLYYSMRQQVAEKFWRCRKVLFWTTSRLSANCYCEVWWSRPSTAGRTEWVLPLTPPYSQTKYYPGSRMEKQGTVQKTATATRRTSVGPPPTQLYYTSKQSA